MPYYPPSGKEVDTIGSGLILSSGILSFDPASKPTLGGLTVTGSGDPSTFYQLNVFSVVGAFLAGINVQDNRANGQGIISLGTQANQQVASISGADVIAGGLGNGPGMLISSSTGISFVTQIGESWCFTAAGTFNPGANNTFDIGTALLQVKALWAVQVKINSNIVAGNITGKLNSIHLAIASQTIGDLLVADTTTTMARLVAVASGSVLVSGGLAALPAWSNSPSLTALTLAGREQRKQGADVASANNLSLGTGANGGNVYVVTGTTQINLIDNTGWQDGSEVRLHFSGTLTVKHNQTTSSNNIKILLSASADLNTAVANVLELCLDTVGGVRAWRQSGTAVLVA